MAKDKDEKKGKEEEDGGNSGPPIMKIVIIAVVLSMLLGGGLVGGTFFFVNKMNEEKMAAAAASEGGVEAIPSKPPEYHSMDPKFIVSFNDGAASRFMQFSVEVMTRDSDIIGEITEHMPVIRSSLLMLFGAQNYQSMLTRAGKEKLLEDVAEDINTTLQKVSGSTEMVSSVEEAYFTSFIIQ